MTLFLQKNSNLDQKKKKVQEECRKFINYLRSLKCELHINIYICAFIVDSHYFWYVLQGHAEHCINEYRTSALVELQFRVL